MLTSQPKRFRKGFDMACDIECTPDSDIVLAKPWNGDPNAYTDFDKYMSKGFDPKIDQIDLQGLKTEDLIVADSGNGDIFIHYIPKQWQSKLASQHTGFLDFFNHQVDTGRLTPGASVKRDYNDIVFWGSRPFSEGAERTHTFKSPEGTAEDFVYLLSQSTTDNFKTWDDGGIVFLGANQQKTASSQASDEINPISIPSKFNKKSADKITNFNPSTDTLEIDANSFGIDSSATFASGKNKKEVKKKLAKQDFDFLYDKKKGGLYFNENGADKGFGEGGTIAILKGAPDLTSDTLEFI